VNEHDAIVIIQYKLSLFEIFSYAARTNVKHLSKSTESEIEVSDAPLWNLIISSVNLVHIHDCLGYPARRPRESVGPKISGISTYLDRCRALSKFEHSIEMLCVQPTGSTISTTYTISSA
jgi:hypothetical protein